MINLTATASIELFDQLCDGGFAVKHRLQDL
jgi:hypothetical protein